jgi:hypothetical protein
LRDDLGAVFGEGQPICFPSREYDAAALIVVEFLAIEGAVALPSAADHGGA